MMRLLKLAMTPALLAASVAAMAQSGPISLAPGETLLKVEATGESRARPDTMGISAGVVTTGRTAKAALSEMAIYAE